MERLCEKCKKAVATGYWSVNIGGKIVNKYLCEDCLVKLANSQNDDYFEFRKQNIDFRCKNCGTSFLEFEDSLYLGCSECYQNFKQLLEPIIADIQYGKHIGKTPDSGDVTGKYINKNELVRLKKLMSEAIKAEDYDYVEYLHDIIVKLEEK